MRPLNPPFSPPATLPTMYDLPSEDLEESGLPDEYHLWQSELCSATFYPANSTPDQIFIASDLNLYYDPQHTNWYKRPDWLAVVGVSRLSEGKNLRLSYVIWQEGIRPSIIIELLSPSTRDEDLGRSQRKAQQPTKWEVYEQILQVPYYIVFDGNSDRLYAFNLEEGGYRQQVLTDAKIWLPTLEIGLGLWQGDYRGKTRNWLRWYDERGNWHLTEAEKERQEKEAALIKIQQLEERLRQAGIDLD